MKNTRHTAVAGLFYPADPQQLQAEVKTYLDIASRQEQTQAVPKAMIVPHAGYVYSGPVAASAYVHLFPAREKIQRVILIGPSHRVPFRGLATSSAESYATPLGEVSLDREAIDKISELPQVHLLDEAHSMEHSLEVHLPFLQETLDHFQLVPLVAGNASPSEVAQVLDALWGGAETLIIISSDLSHYHDYASAQRMDKATSDAITSLDVTAIDGEHACGCVAVNGLLQLAKERGLSASVVDLRNSGDTAGPKDRVVGYGAYVFH